MGGQTGTQQQQSQTVTQLPPWINDAAQQNYGFAQNVASRPLVQYQGQMVPDVGPQLQQSWNTAANSANAGIGQYGAATAGYLNTMGQTPAPITAAQYQASLEGPAAQAKTSQAAAAQLAAQSRDNTAAQSALSQLSNTNLSPYMNPYTQSVINTTLPIYQQNLQLSEAQNNAQAQASNAFGGSRFGIQQGVTQAQGAQGMAQMAEQLNQANFAQAQAAGEYDVTAANNMGQFNAQQLNQIAEANQQQRNQVNMANSQQGNYVNVNNAQMANSQAQFNASAQNSQMQFNAGALNAAGQWNAGAQNQAANWNQQAALSQEGLVNQAAAGLGTIGNNLQQQALQSYGMQNAAGMQQQAYAQDQINAQMAKFNQAYQYPTQQLGVLQSALGMTPYGQSTTGQQNTTTYTPTDWAALAGSGMGMLGNIFMGKSDKRIKKNIKRVGTNVAGTGVYKFNWKGEPSGAPKTQGPIAQEVEKVIPGAVATHPATGVKHIHAPVLSALSHVGPKGVRGVLGHPLSPMQHAERSAAARHPRPRARIIPGALVG